MPDVKLRPAMPNDAPLIRDLGKIASYGLVDAIFRTTCPKDMRLQDYVESRILDPKSKMSFDKCTIAEVAGETAGFINLDLIPLDPAPPGHDVATDSMFRPLAELEAQAAGTVVIEFVATLPAARGKGVGTALLKHAQDRRGPNGVSLCVLDTNRDARRLYEQVGFVEVDRRAVVKQDWKIDATDWILMIRR